VFRSYFESTRGYVRRKWCWLKVDNGKVNGKGLRRHQEYLLYIVVRYKRTFFSPPLVPLDLTIWLTQPKA
jgi:hypothetical protein